MDKTPIYQNTGEYAAAHEEMQAYLASYAANEACRDAIEQAISNHYDGRTLGGDAAREVIAAFGPERTKYILAIYARYYEHDGRMGRDNISWAKQLPVAADEQNRYLLVRNCSPGLINLFIGDVRDEAAISKPVYRGTEDKARKRDELNQYRDSRRANVLCQKEIEQAIDRGWAGTSAMSEAAKAVIGRFGKKRVAYVLASTVRQKEQDGQLSDDNKAWANSVTMFEPEERREAFGVRCSPDKLDQFITLARQEIQPQAKKTRIPPIYKHPYVYAVEHGELKKYFASYEAHESCKKAIEKAITAHYHNYRLSEAGAKEVIAKFGLERTMYVLAATVRELGNDGRISNDNKEWAQSFPLVEDVIIADGAVRDRNAGLRLMKAHPSIIDLFLDQVRDEAAISRPVYRGTFDEAKEAGEVAEYRASFRVNQLCQCEIEQAVLNGWDGMHVAPEAVKGVLERFGPERVSYVLANTIQQKSSDRRFSAGNREWAKSIPMYVPAEKRLSYTVTSHSTMLDDFITVARQEMARMEKERGESIKSRKPSVRKKLKEQSDTRKPSAKPRRKGQER